MAGDGGLGVVGVRTEQSGSGFVGFSRIGFSLSGFDFLWRAKMQTG
jgi:hypothetical protein